MISLVPNAIGWNLEIAECGLDAMTGDAIAEDRHRRAVASLEETTEALAALEQAYDVAVARDGRRAALASHGAKLDELKEFEQVCTARQTAAADLDTAAAAITGAWRRLRSCEELIRLSLPSGCILPSGYSGVRLQDLAAAAVYRQHVDDIHGIGDDQNVFPGAKPPDLMTRFAPGNISSAAEVIADQNSWLMRHLGAQVQRFAEQHDLVPAPDEEAA